MTFLDTDSFSDFSGYKDSNRIPNKGSTFVVILVSSALHRTDLF
jgi:hypothetical protein